MIYIKKYWHFILSFFSIIIILIFNIIYLNNWALNIIFFSFVFATIFLILGIKKINTKATYEVNQNEFQKIIEVIDVGIIIYNINFEIQYFNQAAEKTFQIQASDILGKKITVQDAQNEKLQRLVQVIFPSLAPVVILKSKEGEEPIITDVSFSEPDLFLTTLTAKLKDGQGNVYGFIKIVHDKTLEIKLLKSKSEFVTIASHQFRTPVNEVKWALESILSDQTLNNNLKELIIRSLKSVKKLENLIENLLNISKIEEGRFGYNFKEVDYLNFVKEILSEFLPQIQKYNIELYLNSPQENLPKIYIDQQKIYMVFSNLIDNALKYNVSNGRIIVKIKKSEDDQFIETTVEDTGIGIPQEELKNIFTKFFRASTASKIDTEGSGLGLYVAKKIIQAHGGKIWAESELQRGTKITFILPINPELIPKKEIPLLDIS
ncbi:MAG: ATP-binding protein [Patescibacteria group bacterium]|nr:ATP-binding protein [Patescibacteria group bacterium]